MMPRSLLARTFLLLATLVLLTTAAWLSLFPVSYTHLTLPTKRIV